MDAISFYVRNIDALPGALGIGHPMAHVHAGLAIYMIVQMFLRTRRASGIALQAVFGVEIVHEILQSAYYGSWRLDDTPYDILLTVLWPTLLYGMTRYRRARWDAQIRRIERDAATVLAFAPIPASRGS